MTELSKSSQKLVLYTTSGCHLCDEAQAMVEHLMAQSQLPIFQRYRLHLQEISEDDHLIESYGVRIPVLATAREELGWPFDIEALYLWLVARQATDS